MRKVLLLFVLCVSSLTALAQTARRIGPSQGLLHPTVYDIAQDDYGFVWIGTRDGLFRYNEGNATSIDFLPNALAKSRNIQSLCVRADSTLWIGVQQLGAIAFDIPTMQPLDMDAYPLLDEGLTVQALYEDTRGRLWAGTAGQGLFYLDKEATEWKVQTFAYAPEELMFVFDFAEQGDTLWLGNSGEHLLYFDYSDGRVHSYAQSADFASYSKSVDVQGNRVLFGIAEHGLWVLNQGDFTAYPSPVNNPRDVAFNGQEIWVSTDGDGIHVQDVNGSWRHWTKRDPQLGIATDQFYSINAIGSDFWIGSFNDGISILPREDKAVGKLRNPESFTYTSIQSALCMERLGEDIWVGFDGDGLVRYAVDGGTWRPTAMLDNSQYDYPKVVTSLHASHRGTLWVGTFNDGLLELDSEGRILNRYMAFTDFNRGLANNNIWSLADAGGDSLWVGTLGGLQLWDGTRFIQPWQEPWAVGRNIMDLERDGDALWVGSEFMGLYQVRGKEISHFTLEHPILDLAVHESGLLLIGTEGGGMYEMKDGKIKQILDIPLLTVYGISVQSDRIFATTNTGLLEGVKTEEGWRFSNAATLTETQLALFNRKALSTIGNALWIGGAGGVVQFNAQREVASSELLIVGLKADNTDLPFTLTKTGDMEAVRLSPGTRSVQFYFEIMSLQDRSGKKVEYYVKGIHSDWMPLTSNLRSLTFNNLLPGSYTLEMRLINEVGEIERSMAMPWVVESYIWQRSWFRALALILLFVLIGVGVAVYQDRKLRATRVKLLETERELLAAKAGEMEAKAKQKSDELNFQLLKTSSRIELLQSFRDRLQKERSERGKTNEVGTFLQSLIRDLNRELQSENYWDHFERNYRDLHDAFSDTLVERHPKLTKGEIRLSYLVRQKMNNKEIATVLNVSPAAVEKAKYRLKKKIGLEKEESLDQYLQEL
jgi:ligand-binding sensor domain-containing protein/DNA-binding CsgD family transcriptional regulator